MTAAGGDPGRVELVVMPMSWGCGWANIAIVMRPSLVGVERLTSVGALC